LLRPFCLSLANFDELKEFNRGRSRQKVGCGLRGVRLCRSEAQYTALEEDRRARWDMPPLAAAQSALRFAFAVVLNEGQYSEILQIMLFLNIVFFGQTTITEPRAPSVKLS
jgi:hypothetical protein